MGKLELLSQLTGHSDRVWSISWHPTKPVFATSSGDKSIRIWSRSPTSDSWTCITTLDDAHKRTIRSVAFSPDGRFLASAGFDGTTAIWEVSLDSMVDDDDEGWDCIATLEGHENEVKSVAFSPTGALLATCSRDKSVWIWELVGDNDFECLSVLQEHEQDVKFVTWHPSEEVLASCSYDDTIRIWKEDDDDWYCADTLSGHKSTVWGVDFNANGDMLASVSDDCTLKIWTRPPASAPPTTPSSTYRSDPKWTCSHTIPDHHSRTIYSISWSKIHDRIATCGSDNAIKIVQRVNIHENAMTNGESESAVEFRTVAVTEEAHGYNDVNCVKWGPVKEWADLLVTAGDDGVVRVWRYVE